MTRIMIAAFSLLLISACSRQPSKVSQNYDSCRTPSWVDVSMLCNGESKPERESELAVAKDVDQHPVYCYLIGCDPQIATESGYVADKADSVFERKNAQELLNRIKSGTGSYKIAEWHLLLYDGQCCDVMKYCDDGAGSSVSVILGRPTSEKTELKLAAQGRTDKSEAWKLMLGEEIEADQAIVKGTQLTTANQLVMAFLSTAPLQ
jgi:hypothetical protein